MSKLSDNLLKFRRKHGLTVSQVADFTDSTADEVIDWEEGKRTPTSEQIERLSELFNVDKETLRGDNDNNSFSFHFNSNDNDDDNHTSRGMSDADYSRRQNAKRWYKFPYPMICIVVFLLVGFICKAPDGSSLWHPMWMIFLTIPMYYGIVTSAVSQRWRSFPYPILCLLVYLIIGSIWNIWGWGLLIFLTVPLFYWITEGSVKSIWARFSYPLLCVIVYVTLGFIFGATWWHPGWLIFLTIPIFNSIVTMFR
ncbi:MAG: helix-turn-helix transcriptional regulator, partial [Clostridia bacterium]